MLQEETRLKIEKLFTMATLCNIVRRKGGIFSGYLTGLEFALMSEALEIMLAEEQVEPKGGLTLTIEEVEAAGYKIIKGPESWGNEYWTVIVPHEDGTTHDQKCVGYDTALWFVEWHINYIAGRG